MLDDRRQSLAGGGCELRLCGVRVREPERLAAGVDRSPADPRHAAAAQTHSASRRETEPGDTAVLFALVERELEAEADTEYCPAGGGALTRTAPRSSLLPRPGTCQS